MRTCSHEMPTGRVWSRTDKPCRRWRRWQLGLGSSSGCTGFTLGGLRRQGVTLTRLAGKHAGSPNPFGDCSNEQIAVCQSLPVHMGWGSNLGSGFRGRIGRIVAITILGRDEHADIATGGVRRDPPNINGVRPVGRGNKSGPHIGANLFGGGCESLTPRACLGKT